MLGKEKNKKRNMKGQKQYLIKKEMYLSISQMTLFFISFIVEA